MDSRASIEQFPNFNRSFGSKQKLTYGSLQYLNQRVSIFKTLIGVIVLILSAYLFLYLKSVNDKNLTKEIFHQQKMVSEETTV